MFGSFEALIIGPFPTESLNNLDERKVSIRRSSSAIETDMSGFRKDVANLKFIDDSLFHLLKLFVSE